MSVINDFEGLKDLFMNIDIIYELIEKARKAYELNDISSAYHFIHSAYEIFVTDNSNYTLTELAMLDQCHLKITSEYVDFMEKENKEINDVFKENF